MSFASFLLSLLFLVLSSTAQAEKVSALKIESDYFPGVAYEVGFDLNPQHLIERVYFNEEKAEPVFFSLDELRTSYVTVFKKFGFSFVRMKIVRMDSESSGTIELSILRNAMLGKRRSLYFDVKYNAASGKYQITDPRSGQSLYNLIISTNFAAGMAVGIRDIQPK